MTAFVHLRVHSEFSMIDSMVRIPELMERTAGLGMPSVAITDHLNLFGLIKFYMAAKSAGIKPIMGADIQLQGLTPHTKPRLATLLIQNHQGYLQLSRLLSQGYLADRTESQPVLRWDWLEADSSGLIALSGAMDGEVGQALLANDWTTAQQLAQRWAALFPDRYYLEVRRTGREGEETLLHRTVDLALRLDLPIVATNDVRFLQARDFDAHEVRVCIYQGRVLEDPHRPHDYSEQQYLRSPAEMVELFSDLPEALENTVHIARRCNLELQLGDNYLPNFPTPEGISVGDHLRAESARGLEQRLEAFEDHASVDAPQRTQSYRERLDLELDVIVAMGFPGYFLIVADFIRWAKDQGIPVGPGRGSGAGSLVAYALGITDLDPIAQDLLFERFLNPERVSMPDFDVDFCMDRRDEVIRYVADRYGREAVSQIITYGTMAAKAVVRDVGRVQGLPYGFVDRIAKLVPFDLKMTLDKALEESEELKREYDQNEEVRALLDTGRALEGLVRNVGKHAGGVVIAPTRLTDFSPLYKEPGGDHAVTQFDKDDVEKIGLVKFDFLGLRTLTIIDWALGTVNAQRGRTGEAPIDIAKIPMNDQASFDLLKSAQTTAVFQLESAGMKELVRKLQPDCFDDITALVALFRPGPLQSGMVDDFINRKHGRAEVAYPHPALEPILKPTYGVILYQEQVMQIAQVLAGYTLGGADLLRRAMGKKKPEEMAKQRAIFTEGSVARGVAPETATYIFDLMEKFAGYGFNKSHSAAYALVSYQTLWLKAHHPAAFMAAVMSADMDKTDKVVTMIEECQQMRLQVMPPNLNHSEFKFGVLSHNTIVYGLGAIKGMGESAIEHIVDRRSADGAFRDLFDFCRRVDSQKVNKRVIEALARSGAADCLGSNRATLMARVPLAMRMAEQFRTNQSRGQGDLFGGATVSLPAPVDPRILKDTEHNEWEEQERLNAEKETLGLFLSGHPIDGIEAELKELNVLRLRQLEAAVEDTSNSPPRGRRNAGKEVLVAGMVVACRHNKTQHGPMGSVLLDDRTGRVEATLFPKVYDVFRTLLENDRILVVKGVLGYDDYRDRINLTVNELMDFAEARRRWASELRIQIDTARLPSAPDDWLAEFTRLLQPHRSGNCRVSLDYRGHGYKGLLLLPDHWRITPEDQLLRSLRKRPECTVSVRYRRTSATGNAATAAQAGQSPG